MTLNPVDGERDLSANFRNPLFSYVSSSARRSIRAISGRTEAKLEQPNGGKSLEFVLLAFADSHHHQSRLKRLVVRSAPRRTSRPDPLPLAGSNSTRAEWVRAFGT